MAITVGFRLRGEAAGRAVILLVAPGRQTVGSGGEADVVVHQRGVSRRHAVLEHDGSGLQVEDLKSKNGTWVNGVRVARASLAPGDWLQLGPLALQVEETDATDAQLAVRPSSDTVRKPAAQPDAETEGWAGHHPGDRTGSIALARGVFDALHRGEGIAAALAELTRGLDALGAALLEGCHKTEPLLLAAWGQLPNAAAMASISRGAAAEQRSGDGEDGLAWVTHPASDGRSLALVVLGVAAPADRGLVELLDFVLALAGDSLGRRPPPIDPAPRSAVAVPPGYVVGRSPAISGLHERVGWMAASNLPILVTGETGVGKELVARMLHLSSARARGPFVAVNCASIPGELLEAELFGIEAGVATGVHARPGKLRLAHGGTVLLDEIGDMAPALQAKLLRAVQEREVFPLGARQPVAIDIRLLSATNTDLEARVADGSFRRDLYYRLAGCTLHVPALRDRPEDIPLLVDRVLARAAAEAGREPPALTVKALRLLCQAAWPGNVRELEHELRRLVALCPDGAPVDSSMLSATVLVPQRHASQTSPDDLNVERRLGDLERDLVVLALERCRGNRTRAAKQLGVSRAGLLLKIARLGIDG